MAFTVSGNTIRTSDGREFPPLKSHSEAVREAQKAVKKAEEIANAQGLPKLAVAGLASDELSRRLDRSPLSFGAILEVESHVPDGGVIRLLDPLYEELVAEIFRDPDLVHQLSWRKWEEIVAASYEKAGWDEVILTPRSGDGGRDVIAIRKGFGAVRILDQVKAYSPGHLVAAKEVRELLGVLQSDPNATKAVLSTTSDFAPGIRSEDRIQQHIPYRLELVNMEGLLGRLASTLPFRCKQP